MRSIDFKYENLQKACRRLEEVCAIYDGKDDIIRDSVIQRFEFTYELTHKTLQAFMNYEGITLENSFPRTIYKVAYANGIISDEKVWLQLLEDRNKTSHMYSEVLANEIANRIKNDYLEAIRALVVAIGRYKD